MIKNLSFYVQSHQQVKKTVCCRCGLYATEASLLLEPAWLDHHSNGQMSVLIVDSTLYWCTLFLAESEHDRILAEAANSGLTLSFMGLMLLVPQVSPQQPSLPWVSWWLRPKPHHFQLWVCTWGLRISGPVHEHSSYMQYWHSLFMPPGRF